MTDRTCLFFPMLVGLLSAFTTFNSHAAQKASVSLPIAMQVTNPQCQINKGLGLPETVQLPLITTSGTFLGDNNVEVPLMIDCASDITKFEVTLAGAIIRNSLRQIIWSILPCHGKRAEVQWCSGRRSN